MRKWQEKAVQHPYTSRGVTKGRILTVLLFFQPKIALFPQIMFVYA